MRCGIGSVLAGCRVCGKSVLDPICFEALRLCDGRRVKILVDTRVARNGGAVRTLDFAVRYPPAWPVDPVSD